MAAGRPLKYETHEELKEAIEGYFDKVKADEDMKPTVTGLAYFLGFESRQSMYDYKEREEFSYTIKRSVLYIESIHEANLFNSSASGSIFWLKNRDWTDSKDKDTGIDEYIKKLADALQPIPEAKESD